MVSAHLWSAERLKTWRITRSFYVLLAISGMSLVVLLMMATQNRSSFQQLARMQLAFPLFLYALLHQTASLTPLIAIVYASLVMAIEYRHDTLKALLPRRVHRADFIIVKGLRCAAFIIVVLLIGGVALQTVAAILGRFAGGPGVADVPGRLIPYQALVAQPERYLQHTVQMDALWGYLSALLAMLGIVALRMLFWGIVALVMTVIFRSEAGGILSTFGLYGAQTMVALLSPSLPPLLPSFHLEYLLAHIGFVGDARLVFGGWQPAIGFSLVYSIAGTVAVLILGILLFNRQEIANKQV